MAGSCPARSWTDRPGLTGLGPGRLRTSGRRRPPESHSPWPPKPAQLSASPASRIARFDDNGRHRRTSNADQAELAVVGAVPRDAAGQLVIESELAEVGPTACVCVRAQEVQSEIFEPRGSGVNSGLSVERETHASTRWDPRTPQRWLSFWRTVVGIGVISRAVVARVPGYIVRVVAPSGMPATLGERLEVLVLGFIERRREANVAAEGVSIGHVRRLHGPARS